MKYLFCCNKKARVYDIDNAATSSDDWGRMQDAFAAEALGREPRHLEMADSISLYPDQVTPNGIFYDWGLAGPGGGWYTLLCFAGESDAAISESKAWIRRSFDAVRISVSRFTLI